MAGFAVENARLKTFTPLRKWRCEPRSPPSAIGLYYTPMALPEAGRDTQKQTLPANAPVTVPEIEAVNPHYDTRLPKLPWSRRAQIPFIAAAVYSVICALGPTLRFELLGTQY